MKSYYNFLLPAALFILLNIFTPVRADTIYKERKVSELSSGLFTYDLTIQTSLGELEVEVHARETNEPYVKRVAQILKEDAPPLIEYFGYLPWNKIHFVIDGFVDSRISQRANGSATVFPRPLVILNTVPPVGLQHLITRGDWMKTLVLHEFIHILHLDQTAGFMNIFRYLSGSSGKVGGVVSSWFSEGVATWGEARFTDGGRLTRGLFNFDFNSRVLNKNFCHSSMCLDRPGVYPYRSTAYWYGSHFLKWVEDKKPGSMACIIKDNSSNLPFFLHRPFRNCVGENYQTLFDKYYKETYKRLDLEMKEFRSSKAVATWEYIEIKDKTPLVFSNGFESQKEKVYVSMVDKERNSSLVIFDLKKRTKAVHMFENVIENILSPTNSKELIFKTYSEFPSRTEARWEIYSNDKKKITSEVVWGDAEYVFKLKNNRVIALAYKKNIWEVWERVNGEDLKIFDLKAMTSLFNPEVVEADGKAFITYRFYDHTQIPSNEYLRVDLDTGRVEVLFQSSDTLEVIGSCGTSRVLATKKGLYSLNVKNGFVSNLNKGLGEIASLTGDESYTVLLYKKDPKRVYFKNENCQKWLNSQSGVELKEKAVSKVGSDKNYLEDKSSYPEWDHYLPHHWGVGYSSGDATGGWVFKTGINDPGNVHSIDGQFNIYNGHDKKGGVAAYTYQGNYFDLLGEYSKQFFSSNIKPNPDFNERSRLGVQRDYYLDWLAIIPFFSYSQGNIIDFVSRRKAKTYSAGLKLKTKYVHINDLLRSASIEMSLTKTNTLRKLNYLGHRVKSKLILHPSYKFDILFQGTYEKLDKSDFVSGVAYAGGSYANSFHEFYGIQGNDAYGNEVFTGKLEVDYLLAELYRGPRYFPLFVKKLSLIGGAGLLKTDFIYIDSDNRFLRNKMITSIFAGAGVDINVAYVLPLRVDLVMARIMSGDIKNNQTQTLLLLKAGI